MLWNLAWRNLWRNRGRTLISVGAIAFGLALLLVAMGITADQHKKLEQSAVRTSGGNVLIHGDGYWLAQSSDLVVENSAALRALVQEVDGVAAVIPRVLITGLLTTARGNAGAQLQGIDYATERQMADPARFLAEGDLFPEGEQNPLVIGREIAKDLEVGIGDRVVLTASDVTGEITRALFHVTGILDTGSKAMDRSLAYTTLPAAARAVGMSHQITQLGVLVTHDQQRHVVRDRIVAQVQQQLGGAAAEGLEFLTWDEAIPDLVSMIQMDRVFSYVFYGTSFLIIAFAIANTFLMVVLERIRELGLLGALGLTPAQTALTVLLESVLLSLVGITAGFIFGFLLHLVIVQVGIDMQAMVGGEYDLAGVTMEEMIIRSVIEPGAWFGAMVFVFVMVVLSSLYPALKARGLEPAEAMRTFQ